MKFLHDFFDLLRFRFQPLTHYTYPAWQPLALLGVAAIIGGVTSTEVQAPLPGKIGFFFLMILGETAMMTLWLMCWWKWILRRPFSGSLFPLLALCTGPQFVAPLASYMPGEYGVLLMLTIACYSLVLMLNAVASVLGERRRTVLLALVAVLPLALVFSQFTHRLMASWGWLVLPAAKVSGG